MDIQLKACTIDDAEALALVGQATFLETFAGVLAGPDIIQHCAQTHSQAQYRAWLSDPHYQIYLAEVAPGQAPVGYMVLAPAQLPLADLSATDLEIKRIYLLSKFHGGGIGSRLIAQAMQHARHLQARRLLLGVYAQNTAAIGFYTRCGFKQLGTRQYKVGGQDYDDIIMGMSM